MALLNRDTKLLIFLAIIAIISNAIPFYLLLNYGRP
jgi:energy-coupling factor transporter transmembrane protein EcfT